MAEPTKELGESFGTHFPGSSKVYKPGAQEGVSVPFRTIELNASRRPTGELVENPAFCVYDTSGPWTDPDVEVDVRSGLSELRRGWIDARGDTEAYEE
jgi:phosphomethylpyrimidine synthase